MEEPIIFKSRDTQKHPGKVSQYARDKKRKNWMLLSGQTLIMGIRFCQSLCPRMEEARLAVNVVVLFNSYFAYACKLGNSYYVDY